VFHNSLLIGKIFFVQESSALSNTALQCQVVPRLKPGGRKTLKSGLAAQGILLLFQQVKDDFTEIKKLRYQYVK
jgi:hypothetical protein